MTNVAPLTLSPLLCFKVQDTQGSLRQAVSGSHGVSLGDAVGHLSIVNLLHCQPVTLGHCPLGAWRLFKLFKTPVCFLSD